MPESSTAKGSKNTKRIRDSLFKQMKNSKDPFSQEEIRSMVCKKVTSDNHILKAKKRSMSSHVGSRWYRAPELVIVENKYDQASDMWSFGCCLYELMKIINEEKDKSISSILF